MQPWTQRLARGIALRDREFDSMPSKVIRPIAGREHRLGEAGGWNPSHRCGVQRESAESTSRGCRHRQMQDTRVRQTMSVRAAKRTAYPARQLAMYDSSPDEPRRFAGARCWW